MNTGTHCAFLGGGHLSWAVIQGFPPHGVAAWQPSVGAISEPQRRVAVRYATLLVLAVAGRGGITAMVLATPAAAGSDRLAAAAVAAGTDPGIAALGAFGAQRGPAARWE